MEVVKADKNEQKEKQSKKQVKVSLFQIVWRWHFYAGLIFAPFLIILAVSGSVYLFKPQIESTLYKDLYYIQEEGSSTSNPSAQVANVKGIYPEGIVTSLTFHDDPTRTTEISLMENGQTSSVFVNPYSGEVMGSLKKEEKFTEIFKKLHSELIVGGTVANRLVELAACWAVILLITGLYIWWPRNRSSIWGTILPRFNKKGRTFWRDMHAVPAFWLSLFILILIATGLPWSGVMGEQIKRLATSTNTGYPPFAHSFGEKPESIIKTKDVAENVPWATENLTVPASSSNDYLPLSLEDVTFIAKNEEIGKPYTLSMPKGEQGVYTIATSHTKPGDNATLHVDQYTGSVLSDVRFADYGIMGKGITMGIALHEGRLFGLANQIIGLLVCLGLIGLVISSIIMWSKRKPKGKLGAPAKPKDEKVTRIVFCIMLAMGILMPLVGISILFVFIVDRFILSKIKSLKTWLS
ncbi:PepSY-associated TM helix domain-containing protein [Sporosarcina limicola]|uniref:Iron-regulated membrane protein n=1 Tax=Sporosarcina limicola TaxID=34101 RepID=A0A927RGB6_9BACL|nr:PepSY domain-containing protein [Sporosarcina limicola]MBE1556367.1 putative iron-regulated membrane protein [Sporosarcina limicola]